MSTRIKAEPPSSPLQHVTRTRSKREIRPAQEAEDEDDPLALGDGRLGPGAGRSNLGSGPLIGRADGNAVASVSGSASGSKRARKFKPSPLEEHHLLPYEGHHLDVPSHLAAEGHIPNSQPQAHRQVRSQPPRLLQTQNQRQLQPQSQPQAGPSNQGLLQHPRTYPVAGPSHPGPDPTNLTADISTWAHRGLIQENQDLHARLALLAAQSDGYAHALQILQGEYRLVSAERNRAIDERELSLRSAEGVREVGFKLMDQLEAKTLECRRERLGCARMEKEYRKLKTAVQVLCETIKEGTHRHSSASGESENNVDTEDEDAEEDDQEDDVVTDEGDDEDEEEEETEEEDVLEEDEVASEEDKGGTKLETEDDFALGEVNIPQVPNSTNGPMLKIQARPHRTFDHQPHREKVISAQTFTARPTTISSIEAGTSLASRVPVQAESIRTQSKRPAGDGSSPPRTPLRSGGLDAITGVGPSRSFAAEVDVGDEGGNTGKRRRVSRTKGVAVVDDQVDIGKQLANRAELDLATASRTNGTGPGILPERSDIAAAPSKKSRGRPRKLTQLAGPRLASIAPSAGPAPPGLIIQGVHYSQLGEGSGPERGPRRTPERERRTPLAFWRGERMQ